MEETQIELILTRLGSMITGGKQSQDRDIASLGLKAVVADLQAGKLAQPLVNNLTSVLIQGLQSKVHLLPHLHTAPLPCQICRKPGQGPNAFHFRFKHLRHHVSNRVLECSKHSVLVLANCDISAFC